MDGQGDGMGGRPGHGSERKPLLRAVGYDLLFRFDHSTFHKNRVRLMQHDVQACLMSPEHFSVDGTLIDA